ncbi:unnamed protein product [Dovyalis caffra]|uniref:Uncharacterized protein n=1 Tax=Dovyalis caffra TaxID=77055 RepID=A0AAV1SIA4_9ROSI|nr:unnamed protein product [Dovyalis caffra]
MSSKAGSHKKDDGEEDGAVEVEVDCDGAADVKVLLDDISPILIDRMYSKTIAKARSYNIFWSVTTFKMHEERVFHDVSPDQQLDRENLRPARSMGSQWPLNTGTLVSGLSSSESEVNKSPKGSGKLCKW